MEYISQPHCKVTAVNLLAVPAMTVFDDGAGGEASKLDIVSLVRAVLWSV
jgi:hypothetical protein